MGHSYIEGFLGIGVDFDTALGIHCSTNCYPPIHPAFIPAFKEAIDAVVMEDSYLEITLPNGNVMKAYAIVENAHLWPFVEKLMHGMDEDEDY